MRVLYAGQLSPFDTCLSRLKALRDMEPDTHGFDIFAHLDWDRSIPDRLSAAFETHTLLGPRTWGANQALLRSARELRPDIVWIDTGQWVWASTLEQLKCQGCFLVHHITDALHTRHWRVRMKRRLFAKTAASFDVFITSNIVDHAWLVSSGHPHVLLTDLGYDDARYHPEPLAPDLAAKWNNPIIFIGHYEPHTEAGILALIEAGLPVRVRGHPPWFKSRNRSKLGDHLRPSLGNDDYAYALKGAQIGLCFVSALNYNQTAGRSFETTGSGTFLLAVRTPQHQQCFEEGREAEFFGSHEELVRKAAYFLAHPEERQAIARRGQERCVSSGYSWKRIMARDWAKVLEIYGQRQ